MSLHPTERPTRQGPAATRSAAYVLVVDPHPARAAAAVRECAELLPHRLVVARDGHDAARIAADLGPPVLLVASLSLAGGNGLSVVEALQRLDQDLPVVAWSEDRDVREFARSALAGKNVRLLRPSASAATLRACLNAAWHSRDEETVERGIEPSHESLQDLAERARKRLGVAGAAVYEKSGDAAPWRVAVAWMPDGPMPTLPAFLPAAIEMAASSGNAMLWPDIRSEDETQHAADGDVVRSLAIVPLVRDGRPAGALCVFDSKAHALSEPDLPVLAALSGGVMPIDAAPADAAPKVIDGQFADIVLRRELARARRERLSMSMVLFGAHSERRSPGPVDSIGNLVARAVRGNDLVIRWKDADVLLVLTGVAAEMARHVAERVRVVTELSAADAGGVSASVAELRPTESFEATVSRAAERLRMLVKAGHPRIA